MIEKMYFINLIGYMKNIDYVIENYISKFNIHLEYAISKIKNKDVHNLDLSNPYDELAKKSADILKINDTNEKVDLIISSADAIKIINNAQKFNEEKSQRLNDLESEYKNVIDLIQKFSHFKEFDFNYHLLSMFKFVHYKFGFMPLNNYKQYEAFLKNEKDILLLESEIDKNYMWCAYFTYNSSAKRVDDIFTSFNFEPIELPFYLNQTKLSGSVNEILNGLNKKAANLKTEITIIKSQDEKKLSKREIAAAKKILRAKDDFETRKFGALIYKDFFIFTGWVSERIYKALEDKTRNDESVVLVREDNPKESPPVLLKNNSFFKPFEFLVKMYGIPSYYEIDPTPFLAITYTVLFGLMFGDVGQGLILFLAGLLFRKKGPLFQIMSTLGVSSMIFGMLYGSVFGFENLIPAVWIKPADNINFILFFAIAAGIFLILMSMIFNLINCIKTHNFADFLFGSNGLSGFIFYVCILLLCVFIFTQKSLVWIYLVLAVAILNLLLIAFAEPLKKILRKEKDAIGSNIFLFLFETIIELFENLLSYFTNTISFVRVGAFALSHAGMMSVVMLLSKTEAGSYNWFIVFLGNIIVIALEGLIVGIQVLRLEFYEMFGRFFRGNGREYIINQK